MESSIEPGSSLGTNPLVLENKRIRLKNTQLSNENNELENTISKLEQQVEEAKAKEMENNKKLMELMETVAKYTTERIKFTVRDSEHKQQLSEKDKVIEKIKTELQLAKENCLEKEQQIKQHKSELVKLQNGYWKQKRLLEEKSQLMKEAEEQAKIQISERNKLIEKRYAEISKLQMDIITSEDKNAELAEKLQNLQKEMEEQRQTVKTVKEENSHLNGEILTKNKIIGNLQAELGKCKQHLFESDLHADEVVKATNEINQKAEKTIQRKQMALNQMKKLLEEEHNSMVVRQEKYKTVLGQIKEEEKRVELQELEKPTATVFNSNKQEPVPSTSSSGNAPITTNRSYSSVSRPPQSLMRRVSLRKRKSGNLSGENGDSQPSENKQRKDSFPSSSFSIDKNVTGPSPSNAATEMNTRAEEPSGSSADAKQHRLHHFQPGLGYFCLCGTTLRSKTSFLAHLQYKTSSFPFPCKHCSERFPNIGFLKRHYNRMHKGVHVPEGFGCLRCGETFQNRKQLMRHKRTSSKCAVTSFSNVCGTGWSGGNITVYPARKSSHGVDKAKAGQGHHCMCGRSFSDKHGLQRHLLFFGMVPANQENKRQATGHEHQGDGEANDVVETENSNVGGKNENQQQPHSDLNSIGHQQETFSGNEQSTSM